MPLATQQTPVEPQVKPKRVKILDGEHWFVIGKTGMGKTKIIKEIIKKKVSMQPYLNIYYVDTKKRGDFTSHDGIMYRTEKAPEPFNTMGNRMVWQPLIDDIDEYSAFFQKILDAGLPAIVDIDEAINMNFNGRIPRGLSILMAQGRLPGINVIGGTQEVARAPRQMLSQASHIISFNVTNDYDERMALKYLRLHSQKHLDLKKYQFYYIRPDIDDIGKFFSSYEELIPSVI